ncbi:MAG: hypothetical protein Q7V02_05280 [Methylophilus sp.]|nr:hypothetical protein [Methylophilus sp.]
MATQEQLDVAEKLMMETLSWYAECDIEKLKRTDLGEKLSFEIAYSDIERVVNFYKKLLDCDLKNLPHVTMSQVASTGKATIDVLSKIGTFDPEKSGNPFPERAQLITQLRDRWESDFPTVSPVLAYATKSSADFQRLEREARGTLSQLSEDKSEFSKTSEGILGEMRSALHQVQEAASEAGISQHATHFNTEANTARKMAIIWLISTITLGFITVLYIVLHVEPIISELTEVTALKLVQYSIPRIIIIFVLTFGMVWSAKNFTSNVHNFVVNRHRKNALASFQTFVAGASNQEIKDAVLLQATHAIFMPQDSGYTKSDTTNPTSQIVEVFRGIGKD